MANLIRPLDPTHPVADPGPTVRRLRLKMRMTGRLSEGGAVRPDEPEDTALGDGQRAVARRPQLPSHMSGLWWHARAVDIDAYWAIIEAARAAAGPDKPFHQALTDHLATLTEQDILQYQECFDQVRAGHMGIGGRRRVAGASKRAAGEDR